MSDRRTAIFIFLLCCASLAICGCGGGKPSAATATPSPTANPSTAGLIEQHILFQQVDYTFWIFLPPAYDGTHTFPAILLVHGAGGNGPDMLNVWRDFAAQKGTILVAPTVPVGVDFEVHVVPGLYPAMMNQARSGFLIDPKRIYLFGVSAGGYTVFDAGLPDSTYFAAGGVFAAVITPDFDFLVGEATRKIPFALYIGDHDEFFSVAQAQATVDLLRGNGFPVRFTLFPNLDHNYGAVATQVNSDVWNFFTQTALP